MILLKVGKMEIFGLTGFVCHLSYAGIQHFNKGSYLILLRILFLIHQPNY